MTHKKQESNPNAELQNLLKRLLVLQLFAMGVSQGSIAKKLKMNLNTVNDFLKGIKKENASKKTK
jgi:DNA-binding NarL/FixJ family response regulator